MSNLDDLRQKFNFEVRGLENYPKNEHNILIGNHNCIMDIFFLPMAVPEELISYISARLVYKNEQERKEMVEKYLHAMPVEAHGGKVYSDICLNSAIDMLKNDANIAIYPEGAYVDENIVFRGRTGATRILYETKKYGLNPNLVPVAIDIDKSKIDLNDYKIEGNKVVVTILPPVDYEDYYSHFIHTYDDDEKNECLHKPLEEAMSSIAQTLNREYQNEYIVLKRKGNVIFANGQTIDVDEAQKECYIKQYYQEVETRQKRVLARLRNN